MKKNNWANTENKNWRINIYPTIQPMGSQTILCFYILSVDNIGVSELIGSGSVSYY
jgi:hypothetical protein